MDDVQRSIGMIELSIALLLEAHERLEQLCRVMNEEHVARECTETAKQIASQIQNLRWELTVLKVMLNL